MNRLCELLRIDRPLLSAPMAGVPGTPELAGAVSRAGGLGVLGLSGTTCAAAAAAVRAARRLACGAPVVANAQVAPAVPATGDERAVLALLRPFRRELGLPPEPVDLPAGAPDRTAVPSPRNQLPLATARPTVPHVISSRTEQWHVLRTCDPWAVQALADVQLEVEVDTWGHQDLWAPAYVWRAVLDDAADTEHRLLVATSSQAAGPSPDDVVGVGLVHLPRRDNTRLALVNLMVRPGSRRAGVGRALQHAIEQEASSAGRTTLVGHAASTPEPPPGPGALQPAEGAGRVAAQAASTCFALAHGYELAQVARASVLQLPDDRAPFVAMRDAALAAAGPDYRLHTWHDEIPAGSLGQVAVLLGRMSVDAPHASLPYEPEPWDAARAGRWVRSFTDRGLHMSITVAQHVPSGVLAGHTVLMYPVPEVPFAFQQDTLVLTEHRGHRLGTAVKAANLLAVGERRPGLRRVHTDNAQENAPMLAVNVALGFALAGVHACWQKSLA